MNMFLCKLEPWSKAIGVDRLLNYNHYKYSVNNPNPNPNTNQILRTLKTEKAFK